MTDEHKAALAQGREQGLSVRHYLDALDSNKPKRGRRRTPDSIKKRLEAIEAKIGSANSLNRLLLLQEKTNLKAELNTEVVTADTTELERAFVQNAADYGRRKGISYSTWRSAGVAAATLKRAGINQGG